MPCAPFFSKPEPRPYQREIIGILRDIIEEKKKKYIFMQLPTGAGKSEIAVTIAEYFRRKHSKDYYMLSMDHGLTAQYKRDYPFLKEVKGRQNFNCILENHRHLKASEAPCTSKHKAFRCPIMSECPYIMQREEAKVSRGTLSTPYYIDLCTPGVNFETRFLAIRDEAHKLENFYLQVYEIIITERDYATIYPGNEMPSYNEEGFWRKEVMSMELVCRTKLSRAILEDDIITYERLIEKMEGLNKLLSMTGNVVIDVETSKRGYKIIKFRPVKCSTYTKEIIDGVAEHTIFMSATLLSIKDRCEHLGLDLNDVAYINFKDSFFPKENRHIIYLPCGSMSYKRREKTIPELLDTIEDIILKRKEMRGVIICASHQLREIIYKEIKRRSDNPENIITHNFNPGSFNDNFEKFLTNKSKPYVFITTRYEGLDFPGKLAEYLIYTNLPYPPPQDRQIAARLKMEQESYTTDNSGSCGYEVDDFGMCKRGAWCHNCRRWYDLKVAEAFQQAMGRIIRTPEDVGYLYILDSRFEKFYNQNEDLFLSYLKESIEEGWQNGKKERCKRTT
jgi:Rad3-related DNA helicase